jgi:hypothetical protein
MASCLRAQRQGKPMTFYDLVEHSFRMQGKTVKSPLRLTMRRT